MAYTKFNEFIAVGSIDSINDYLVGYRNTGSSNKEIRFPVSLFNITDLSNKIGNLSSLTTTNKDNLVYAINEVNGSKITLSSLSATTPLVYNTGVFSIPAASSTSNGYLSSSDWIRFNNNITGITLTTNGTSGVSTYTNSSNTLNIPHYVGLTTDETISGNKTFSDKVISNNIGTVSDIDFKLYRNNIVSGYIGSSNTNIGYNSVSTNNTGGSITSFGLYSLYSNTSGSYNSAYGANTLKNNTTGSNNTTVGSIGLYSNISGISNTAIGYGTLYSNTTGSNNTALGYLALNNLITGSENIAIGCNAGLHAGSDLSQTNLTTNSDCIYIGVSSYSKLDGSNNEIVIGNSTYGNGSNTTTIGNANTTDTYIKGIVHTSGLTNNMFTSAGIITNNSSGTLESLTYINDTTKFLCSDGTWDTVITNNLVTFNTLTSDTVAYTIMSTDSGKTIEFTSSNSSTLIIPEKDIYDFPIGTEINIMRYGTGTVTITVGSDNVLRSRGNLVTIGHQYAGVTLVKRSNNTIAEWYLIGDLA